MNYHKTHSIDAGDDIELDDNDFFNINGAVDMNINDALQEYTQLSDVVSINAILDKVYQVGTIKQQYMFMCLLRGMDFERIGNIFGISDKAVRVQINKLLDVLLGD
ncbi:hypothetical protein AB4G91_06810 [Macrococcoides goetzii]